MEESSHARASTRPDARPLYAVTAEALTSARSDFTVGGMCVRCRYLVLTKALNETREVGERGLQSCSVIFGGDPSRDVIGSDLDSCPGARR